MAERASDPVAEGFLAAAADGAAVLERGVGGDRWVHVRANGRYAELLGFEDPSELAGTPPDDRVVVDAGGPSTGDGTAGARGESGGPLFGDPADYPADGRSATVIVRRGDGDRVPVDLSVAPAGDRLVVTAREVGHCDRQDHAVLEEAVDTMEDLLTVVDDDGRIVRVNDAVERGLGLTAREVRERPLTEFVTEGHHDRLPDRENGLPDEDRSVVIDVVDADGDRIPYEFRGRTWTCGDGDRYRVSVGREMSDREERERLLASLHEATRNIQQARTPEEACQRGVQAADEILGWDHVAVWQYDGDADALVPTVGHQAGVTRFTEGDTEWEIFQSGDPGTVQVNESHPVVDDVFGHIGRGLVFPLGDHGVLGAADRDTEEYDERDWDTLALLAAHVQTALDRIERERTIGRERDRFTTLFESVPEPVVHVEFVDGEPLVRNVNSAFETTFGHGVEAVLGESLDEFVVPEGREGEAVAMNRQAEELTPVDREVRRLTDDGERDFLFRSLPFDDEEGTVESIGIYVDITERKQRERELERQRDELERLNRINELLLGITRALAGVPSREEVEETVCERLAESDLYRFAWVGTRDVDGDRIVPGAASGEGEDYLAQVAESDDALDGQGPGGRALRSREVQVSQDVRDDPEFADCRAVAEGYDFRSMAAVPLVHGDAVYGLLAVYAGRPGAFTEHERAGLRTLGETVGFVLNAIENRKLLVADTVRELEFDIRNSDGGPLFARASAEFDCRITLDGYTAQGEDGDLLYASVEGVAPGTLADFFREFDGIGAARAITETDDGGRIEVRSTGTSAVRAALDAGAAVTAADVSEGTTTITVEAPQSADTRRISDRITSLFDDAELTAVRERDRPVRTAADIRESLDERLTDRRLEALRTAYLAGYFEWPRDADAEEVADLMGIASPTLHNHLRKAQDELLSVLFEAGPVGTDPR